VLIRYRKSTEQVSREQLGGVSQGALGAEGDHVRVHDLAQPGRLLGQQQRLAVHHSEEPVPLVNDVNVGDLDVALRRPREFGACLCDRLVRCEPQEP